MVFPPPLYAEYPVLVNASKYRARDVGERDWGGGVTRRAAFWCNRWVRAWWQEHAVRRIRTAMAATAASPLKPLLPAISIFGGAARLPPLPWAASAIAPHSAGSTGSTSCRTLPSCHGCERLALL